MGWNADSDFSWIDYRLRGWTVPANISYMESHDEERLMYKNLQYGNASGTYNIRYLATALNRMELAGAFYFTIPGPKMIWQFGELGYDYSIDYDCRVCNKPIRWDYYDVADRKDVYNTWSKLIQLKKQEAIFETGNFTLDVGNTNGLKKIQLTDDATNPNLKYVTILGNFGVTAQSIVPNFQQTGTWYNLLNGNSTLTVTNVSAPITLQPGEFKVYGSGQVTLAVKKEYLLDVAIYPNPTQSSFRISAITNLVNVYDLSGRLIKSFNGTFDQNYLFDISGLKPSLYVIKVKTDNGVGIKKIVKL